MGHIGDIVLKNLESSTRIVIEDFESSMLKEMDDEMIWVRKIKNR